jgi:hypothetical protein
MYMTLRENLSTISVGIFLRWLFCLSRVYDFEENLSTND